MRLYIENLRDTKRGMEAFVPFDCNLKYVPQTTGYNFIWNYI